MSLFILSSFTYILFRPLRIDSKEIKECPKGTPIFLKTVLSLRSLCNLDFGNLFDRKSNSELAKPILPSEFSKSIGLTL